MKTPFILVVLILISYSVSSQYTLYKEVDGVAFYTKWGNEKWWSKKSPKVLLVKVKNNNELAVNFTLGVEFFKEMQLVESGKGEEYCLNQHATANPRMRGLVFKPSETANPDNMGSFELSGLEIKKLTEYECPKK